MDNLPQDHQESSITLKKNEYMNFETMMNGHKISLRFEKVPNFYVDNKKEYYMAQIRTEGLKVGTATLDNEKNMVNIKLHSSKDLSNVRNLNFVMPSDTRAKEVLIQITLNTLFISAPRIPYA